MTRFLTRTDPNHKACDDMTFRNQQVADSLPVFHDTTNIVPVTPQPPIHTPSIPNSVPYRDPNSHFYLGPDPTIESGNKVMETPCADPPTILTSGPENTATEANAKSGSKVTMLVKSRKRARKEELDTSLMLPEGATRAHKPRQMADKTCWEGIAAPKRPKKRV